MKSFQRGWEENMGRDANLLMGPEHVGMHGHMGGPNDTEAETRERILLAAASLFAGKGYAATSVREIAESARVTKPTLYYYFKNKEDLYVQLLDHANSTFCQLVGSALSVPGGVRDRLLAFYSTVYGLFVEHLDVVRLIYSMFYGPPGAAPDYDFQRTNDHLEGLMHQVLQEGVDAGELREDNLEEASFMLLGMLDSLSCLLVAQPQRPALNVQDLGRLVDLVFDGACAVLRSKEGDR
ncbi:MAG TPA: TetR/AcrR family transcriptional regulator [Syntrophobacteraceae bacterium]|nr:TetR/AcrR family transcriptional regulator [Syntrophobacteraceae bacterium]